MQRGNELVDVVKNGGSSLELYHGCPIDPAFHELLYLSQYTFAGWSE